MFVVVLFLVFLGGFFSLFFGGGGVCVLFVLFLICFSSVSFLFSPVK